MNVLTEDATRAAKSIVALYNSLVNYLTGSPSPQPPSEEENQEKEKKKEIKEEKKEYQSTSTIDKLKQLLQENYYDIKQIKDICWLGCPSEYRREAAHSPDEQRYARKGTADYGDEPPGETVSA